MDELTSDALLDAARTADAAGGVLTPDPKPEAPETPPVEAPEKKETAPETKPEEPRAPEAEPEKPKAERQRGPDGKFVKGEPAGKGEPTEFDKAKAEEARQRSVLKNFEEEKARERAAIKAERERLEAEKRAIAEERAQQKPEAVDEHGYTAKTYRQWMETFRKEGDFDNAFKCLDSALKIEAFEQEQIAKGQQDALVGNFDADFAKTIRENADLQDASAPIHAVIQEILGKIPEIYYLQRPVATAYEYAKQIVEAKEAGTLRTKVAELEKELSVLRKATQPSGGAPAGAPAEGKGFEELAPDKQLAAIVSAAQEADATAWQR